MKRSELEVKILTKLNDAGPGRAYQEMQEQLIAAHNRGYRELAATLIDTVEEALSALRAGGQNTDTVIKRGVLGEKIKICAEMHILVQLYLSMRTPEFLLPE